MNSLFLVIEHLPQEVRDRLAEMRNLDATVQSYFIFLDSSFYTSFIISTICIVFWKYSLVRGFRFKSKPNNKISFHQDNNILNIA